MRLLWIKKDQAIFRVHICGKTTPAIKHGTYMLLQGECVNALMGRSGNTIDHFTVIKVT